MKIDRNTQIPNKVVYGVLYAIIFGVSIWLLAFHKESPTNWILYVGVIWAVLGGLLKLGLHYRKRKRTSSLIT